MPPSPGVRISVGSGVRAENRQTGRRFENDFHFRQADDDLSLFNEVQNKERDNFFLQSNDDFDDVFSTRLRYFSDCKRGISTAARGESSDLLNAEGDKHDYDWLITPPETPLFTSLDDETLPVSLASNGRPRSKPISISRSSTMEKTYRSARSTANPHRLSPSPRSGSSPVQPRSRPLSATRSSPPPSLRHSPPPRRPSPPRKPVSRSVTPTPRRMSSDSTVPSKTRGTSPVETARGNSASPKVRAWQSNIPGFSSEAPPNLRTSLSDRPASYVRGSSPASRNSSRSGRQSMSPTASRSVCSSHSLEKEQFSSFSRGSVVSSCDDDVDSQQSIAVSSSNRSVPRNTSALTSNRAVGFSKKPTKVLSSSVPKRSFDLALRQMERKGPRNMFRPLLSSVPSSTFYAGKTNVHHRPLMSRNSSITTSSNASSDQVISGALDAEENQEDVTSRRFLTLHDEDEVFSMDQVNSVTVGEQVEESRHPDGKTVTSVVISQLGVPESPRDTATVPVSTDIVSNCQDVDGPRVMEVCSKCRCKFHSNELVMEGERLLCPGCMCSELNLTERIPVEPVLIHDEVLDQSASVPESLHVTNDCGSGRLQLQQLQDSSDLKDNVSEGTGISLLLKRSNRGVLSKSLTTSSNISYEDLSYARDSLNSMRSSIGHSIGSASSSVDLGSSSRKSDIRMHRQLSWQRCDVDTPSKHERSISSLSGASGETFRVVSNVASNYVDDRHDTSLSGASGEEAFRIVPNVAPNCLDRHDTSLTSEFIKAESTCTDVESNIIYKTVAELSIHLTDDQPDLESHGNVVESTNCSIDPVNEEIQISSQGDENATLNSSVNEDDVAEVPHPNCLDAILETEIENVDVVSKDSQSNSKNCENELLDHSISVVTCDDGVTTAEESDIRVPVNDVHESTVLLEDNRGAQSRSLTLEEATDTILFCSSIVHDLAYEAADKAIQKDITAMELQQPTITFVGKSNPDRRDIRPRTLARRSKTRQKKLETNAKPRPVVAEVNEKSTPPPKMVDTVAPMQLESKCNCTIM